MARQKKTHAPHVYHTLALEEFTVTDLTDALGVKRAAALIATTCRSIYTVRNTNVLGVERQLKLIAEVRSDEARCRERLVVLRQRQLDKSTTAA